MIAPAIERFGKPHDPALPLVMGVTDSRAWRPAACCEGLAVRVSSVVLHRSEPKGRSGPDLSGFGQEIPARLVIGR